MMKGVNFREQFAKETLLRDEHEEMKRYVETNMLKETAETVNEPTPSVSHDRVGNFGVSFSNSIIIL